MRKYKIVFFAIAFVFLSSSCNHNESVQIKSKSVLIEKIPVAREEKPNAVIVAEEVKFKEVSKPLKYSATCVEKEEKNLESEDPTIIKACTFKNYKTILTGMANYKGQYSWEYNLYKISNNKEFKIDNTLLFNQNQNDLLRQINQKIKADYILVSNDAENGECLEMLKANRGSEINDFGMNDLGIQFESDKIVFHVEYSLPNTCRAIDGTSISFTLEEVESYINE